MSRPPSKLPTSAMPPRVAWVAVEPTPYNLPLLSALHDREDLQFSVYFCSHQQHQPWALAGWESLAEPASLRPPRRLAGRTVHTAILQALHRHPWDAVVLSGYGLPTMQCALLDCLARRIPVLMHTDTHLLRPRRWLTQCIKRIALYPWLRRCSAGLAVGKKAAEYWEALGMPRERIFHIPYPSHLDNFRLAPPARAALRQQTRAKWNLAPEALVGIYMGRLVREKGVDLALAGLAELPAECRPHLLLAGDGPERGPLQAYAAQRSLPVTLVGFCQNDHLPALLAAADFLFLPSRDEPWGVVVAEAMAAGLPVVLSDQVGAGYDLLDDGRNGFLVRTADAPAWRDALARCYLHRDRLPFLGREAQDTVRIWTCDRTAAEFRRAITAVLVDRRPTHEHCIPC